MTTIPTERVILANLGLTDMVLRSQWGSTFDYTNARDVDEPADHQFVHISVTNPGSYSSNSAHMRAIEAIGKSRFPATGISYNRAILPGGQPHEGQPIGRRGAHTINDDERATCDTSGCPSRGRSLRGSRTGVDQWNLNYNARAYVFARNCGDAVTADDVEAMARCLAADRLAVFVKRDATLNGHRCCSAKECPCEPAWGLMGQIETRMKFYLAKGNVTPEEDDMTEAELVALYQEAAARNTDRGRALGNAIRDIVLGSAERTGTIREEWAQTAQGTADAPAVNVATELAEIKTLLQTGGGMTIAEIADGLKIEPNPPS